MQEQKILKHTLGLNWALSNNTYIDFTLKQAYGVYYISCGVKNQAFS
jgi:hypothetical protein